VGFQAWKSGLVKTFGAKTGYAALTHSQRIELQESSRQARLVSTPGLFAEGMGKTGRYLMFAVSRSRILIDSGRAKGSSPRLSDQKTAKRVMALLFRPALALR